MHLATAMAAAQACAGRSEACSLPEALKTRERIEGGTNGGFTADWRWLGKTLDDSKAAKPEDRRRSMETAEAHLRAWNSQSAQRPAEEVSAAEFRQAQTAARQALAREEFRVDDSPGWFERKFARLQDWLFRVIAGMGRIGNRAPWLAPLIEWSCFALAVAGLLWFVRQNLARQALRITLAEGGPLRGSGKADTADWERLAREQAEAQDWREAVHSLYWAAIALLESRRAWRSNATRTPREYLRLLRPGSEAQRALRELTRELERVWYGFGEAGRAQYQTALAALEALRAAKTERAGEPGNTQDGTRSPSLAAAGGA